MEERLRPGVGARSSPTAEQQNRRYAPEAQRK